MGPLVAVPPEPVEERWHSSIESMVRDNRNFFECSVTLAMHVDKLLVRVTWMEQSLTSIKEVLGRDIKDLIYLINRGDRSLKDRVKKMEKHVGRLGRLEAQVADLIRDRDRRLLCELD